jgi:hypothetical protein
LKTETIRDHLMALKAYELVERNTPAGQFWRRLVEPGDPLLDTVAEFLGSAGHRAGRAELNSRERLEANRQFHSLYGMTRGEYDLAG